VKDRLIYILLMAMAVIETDRKFGSRAAVLFALACTAMLTLCLILELWCMWLDRQCRLLIARRDSLIRERTTKSNGAIPPKPERIRPVVVVGGRIIEENGR
jgi:hypothetical protein